MGNTLIIIGGLIALFGFLINLFQKFNLPLLPGDILIQKDNFTFYFPLMTSIILSIIISIIINYFK